MKKIITLFSIALIAFSCEQQATSNELTTEEKAPSSQNFGVTITEEGAIPASDLIAALEGKDSLLIKITGKIEDVCQKKGCWMNIALDDKNSVFVKFKDYEFFVPKDAAGKEMVMEGVAFMDVTSVEDLKHYAEDAGEPQEKIDAITEPEVGYGFMANGVIIKE